MVKLGIKYSRVDNDVDVSKYAHQIRELFRYNNKKWELDPHSIEIFFPIDYTWKNQLVDQINKTL